jgi:hypothetical protein
MVRNCGFICSEGGERHHGDPKEAIQRTRHNVDCAPQAFALLQSSVAESLNSMFDGAGWGNDLQYRLGLKAFQIYDYKHPNTIHPLLVPFSSKNEQPLIHNYETLLRLTGKKVIIQFYCFLFFLYCVCFFKIYFYIIV